MQAIERLPASFIVPPSSFICTHQGQTVLAKEEPGATQAALMDRRSGGLGGFDLPNPPNSPNPQSIQTSILLGFLFFRENGLTLVPTCINAFLTGQKLTALLRLCYPEICNISIILSQSYQIQRSSVGVFDRGFRKFSLSLYSANPAAYWKLTGEIIKDGRYDNQPGTGKTFHRHRPRRHHHQNRSG
jgi:hypothetical protein